MVNFKKIIKNTLIFRATYMIFYGLKFYNKKIYLLFLKSFTSKEITSFNYSLTDINFQNLIKTIATITSSDYTRCQEYYDELYNNQNIVNIIKTSRIDNFDSRIEFSGRILNYIFIRQLKPKLVIENGVEIGVNSLLMCEALKKNIEEGYYGEFIGVDINPNSGVLLKREDYHFAKLIIQDTIKFLSSFDKNIDYYFSDGCRFPDYERKEFKALEKHIHNSTIIVSNKSTFSNELLQFAIYKSRKFITFKEDVQNHWYPGATFGFFY
jgi:predicted O-methyltransferase YrrM